MKPEVNRFITDIVKPWETLNAELRKPYGVNSEISDFTSMAGNLAVSLKHISEYSKGIKPSHIKHESRDFEIIYDLADSHKHGVLDNPIRQCKMHVSSVYERRSDVKLRFLRNRINIEHAAYGKVDFISCAKEAGLFVLQKIEAGLEWSPMVINNSGEFTDTIRLHISKTKQVAFTTLSWEIVELQENGEYINVDLNGSVQMYLTSDL